MRFENPVDRGLTMNKILVPIEDFSWLSMSAAYFAVEFAKRNPTKILFLIFSSSPEEEGTPPVKKNNPWPKPFEDLIQQARAEKINLELLFSSEGYLETVRRFARDHNISEVIIAVPPAQEPIYNTLNQKIDALRSNIASQIVIVRPKEDKSITADRKLKTEGDPTLMKFRTITDKEGI
jgi:hypothetical protein